MEIAIGGMEATGGTGADRRPDAASLRECLHSLIRRQLESNPANPYLIEHSQQHYIHRHVWRFCQYVRFLPEEGTILDWGCQHAPDSCLLKCVSGGRLQIHGCDFVAPHQYSAFYEYAGMEYRQLKEIVSTPNESGTFDAVIASGVLEHVAMDYESLKELHRVLKPDGILVITYLPNALTVKEWFRRVIVKRGFHRRLYGMREARQLLKRTGFYPVMARHACPNRLLAPLSLFVPSLTLVAQKVYVM